MQWEGGDNTYCHGARLLRIRRLGFESPSALAKCWWRELRAATGCWVPVGAIPIGIQRWDARPTETDPGPIWLVRSPPGVTGTGWRHRASNRRRISDIYAFMNSRRT